MKIPLASLSILLLSSGVALSEPSERSVFLPAVDTVSEPVRRAKTEKLSMGSAALAPAKVKQVDRNKDGKISFAELLTYDMKLDF